MANLHGFDHHGQEDMDEFVYSWASKFTDDLERNRISADESL